jgi:hypothetical protein
MTWYGFFSFGFGSGFGISSGGGDSSTGRRVGSASLPRHPCSRAHGPGVAQIGSGFNRNANASAGRNRVVALSGGSGFLPKQAETRTSAGGWRDLLAGNVLWLSIVSLLNDAASEMIYPLLPFFLVTTLGAGPAFLGLVEGVAESASSLLKLLSGWLSDRFQRRKPLVVAGYGIAGAVRPLIALVGAPW